MGDRKIRVGELIQRELSQALHAKWRTESVAITLTNVDMTPDLKRARVFYSVIGDREAVARAGKLLMSKRNELRYIMGKNVILKYTPELQFIYDPSVERGMHLLKVMDELAEQDENSRQDSEEEEENPEEK